MPDYGYPSVELMVSCPRCRLPHGVEMYYRQMASGLVHAWIKCADNCGFHAPCGAFRTMFDAEASVEERVASGAYACEGAVQ